MEYLAQAFTYLVVLGVILAMLGFVFFVGALAGKIMGAVFEWVWPATILPSARQDDEAAPREPESGFRSWNRTATEIQRRAAGR